jgi:hypothetical protein
MKPRKVHIWALLVILSGCSNPQPQTSSETHFQMCETNADCKKDEACLSQYCEPVESVSGAGAHVSSDGLAVQVNGQSLSLQVDPKADLRYQTCDLFEGLDKQVGGAWVSIHDDLPGTYYQRSTFDGYMLDGQFVPPSSSAGCDLVECTDLPDGADIGAAIEYVETGTTTPPSDYEYRDPFVRPSTINVYGSQPLHATKVRTYVKYFTDAGCGERHDVALEATLP